MRVARRLINKGYSVLNGQSERAFDAIHCFSIFYKGLRQLNCLQYTSLFSLYRPAEIISVSVKKNNSSNNYDGERCRPKLSGLNDNA